VIEIINLDVNDHDTKEQEVIDVDKTNLDILILKVVKAGPDENTETLVHNNLSRFPETVVSDIAVDQAPANVPKTTIIRPLKPQMVNECLYYRRRYQ